MQSNWDSDLVQPVWPWVILHLDPPVFAAVGVDFGGAVEHAAGAVFLGDETAIELFSPATLSPDVREPLAAIHVAQDDVARLKLEFGQGLQDMNAVRFIGDVHPRNSCHYIAGLQRDYRFAVFFPAGVQRNFVENDPFPEFAALEGACVEVDDRKRRFDGRRFAGRRRGLRREQGACAQTERYKESKALHELKIAERRVARTFLPRGRNTFALEIR